MIDTDTLFSGSQELTRLFKRKKLSPVKLTEAYLARIEKLNPRLNAFVTVTKELALREATQAEKEINAGLHRGPLHGIPYAVKDLFAVKGYTTTWGARPYAQQVIDEDATVVRKLRDAGAILLGKCAMSELAGGPPRASLTGACKTPWDLSRWSGGSSSGSGTAVAAGLAVFSIGTETWGSIMTPASFCGVTGLRPTFGRISRGGAMALSWTMDKVGPLARTAADCSIILNALRGRDESDDDAVDAPFRPSLSKARERVSALRLGFINEDYDRWGEPDVASAFEGALGIFRNLGIEIREVKLPAHSYETVAGTIIAAEEAAAFESLVRQNGVREIIDPERRGELRGGQSITAVDYLRCQRLRRLIANDYRNIFEEFDILMGPTTLRCAPAIDATLAEIFPGGNESEAAENLLGLPAISIPCGFNRISLPIGLKIIGRPFAEADILEAAHLYQSLTDWHKKRPRL